MIRTFLIAFFLSASGMCAETREDLLSFTNGDQLHGRFEGVGEGNLVSWLRADVGGRVEFHGTELRKIILRGGRPVKSLSGMAHIGTVNGDRIPGTIREMDDKRLILDTEFGGELEIPRGKLGLIAPSPFGGRTVYHGPHDEGDWTMMDLAHPGGIPEGAEKGGSEPWDYAGSAWYWKGGKPGTALAKKDGMPDRAILKFDIAWKKRLAMSIGFHADFQLPDLGADAEKKREMLQQANNPAMYPAVYGRSYVLQINSNYVMLFRNEFEQGGILRPDRVQTNHSGVRLGDSGTATIELRCNRETGEIILFVNGEFIVQWSEGLAGQESGYAGKGPGFGFIVQSEDSPVRISEVVVAEWNGMPDAARSMQVDDADIVLLTNGTDRFAGDVAGIDDGMLKLVNRYGLFEFPMADVAEVRFSKHSQSKDEGGSGEVRVRLHPLGRISGTALGGDRDHLRLQTEAAGTVEMGLDAAVMLEFDDRKGFLDDWDIEF